MSLPTNFFIGRSGGGGNLYEFQPLYFEPNVSSVNTSSQHRVGLGSLSDYSSLLTSTQVSATIAATRINPLTGSPYLAMHSTWKKIQWVVPEDRAYNFEVQAAQGGSNANGTATIGGRGAKISGILNLNAGDIISIGVGLCQAPQSTAYSNGGGGASYIAKIINWNATGQYDQTPIVIAGGGGGCGGTGYSGSGAGSRGSHASYDLSGSYGPYPYVGSGVPVNSQAGGGGLGGNGIAWSTSMGFNIRPTTPKSFQLNTQTVDSSSMYNGTAGGGGWWYPGHNGYNESYGGRPVYETARGGLGQDSTCEGGFGGGGGARNTSGGGGGGYIGGSGGHHTAPDYPYDGGTFVSDIKGGLGGMSYFDPSFGSVTTATLGPNTGVSTHHLGHVYIW